MLQLTSTFYSFSFSFFFYRESILPCLQSRWGGLAAWKAHISYVYHKLFVRPKRYKWLLTPGLRGTDEGLETKLGGWIEVTDESFRRSSKKRKSRELLRGKDGWSADLKVGPPSFCIFRIACLSFLPQSFSHFTIGSLFLWRPFLPSQRKEKIPEDRKRRQLRSKQTDEDGWMNALISRL